MLLVFEWSVFMYIFKMELWNWSEFDSLVFVIAEFKAIFIRQTLDKMISHLFLQVMVT